MNCLISVFDQQIQAHVWHLRHPYMPIKLSHLRYREGTVSAISDVIDSTGILQQEQSRLTASFSAVE